MGPMADNHHPKIPGDIWLFGIDIENRECYLKFQIKNGDIIFWTSTHPAEYSVEYPLKNSLFRLASLEVLMMTKKVFYNEELDTTEEYSEVWKYELMQVKDIPDLIVRNHYWKDDRGELWLDFDDPNENFRRAFNAYRSRKGFMQPNDIKQLRENLHLSQRVFSERLGISHAKASRIENNKRVQTLSQEISFRKAQQDCER